MGVEDSDGGRLGADRDDHAEGLGRRGCLGAHGGEGNLEAEIDLVVGAAHLGDEVGAVGAQEFFLLGPDLVDLVRGEAGAVEALGADNGDLAADRVKEAWTSMMSLLAGGGEVPLRFSRASKIPPQW